MNCFSASHYYTSDYNKMMKAKSSGFQSEGLNGANLIEGYCVPQNACGATKPIYKYYNKNSAGICL